MAMHPRYHLWSRAAVYRHKVRGKERRDKVLTSHAEMVAEFNSKYSMDMLCNARGMKKGGYNGGFADNKLVTLLLPSPSFASRRALPRF
jgi:hypothetical protein